jgi:UDP-N-acetylmuramate: L-alanyl-gamma-D-glutamyl-meso-diaminopimelate ligase
MLLSGKWLDGEKVGEVKWGLVGEHNMHNGLMAIAAARHVGVVPADAANALGSFINARRRLELRGEANGVTVYDDFAHHPTAILATLAALRGKVGGTARIIAVLEPRSNTMKWALQRRSGAVVRPCGRSVPAATSAYSVAGSRSR